MTEVRYSVSLIGAGTRGRWAFAAFVNRLARTDPVGDHTKMRMLIEPLVRVYAVSFN